MLKSTLVTGGAGFIGANYVLNAVAQGRQIVNLDALTYAGNLDSLEPLASNDNHVFVRGSIGDAALVSKLLADYRPMSIVNFAAESHVDRSIDSPATFIDTNVVGTHTLLMASLRYWNGLSGGEKRQFRFLHVSTDEVFGSLGPEGYFSESTPYAPNSPYAASKAAADHLVRAYHHTYGLPTLTSNCSNNYGPLQFPEKLIPLMILNAMEGKPLPVYGKGNQVRDWLYVEDHVRALDLLLQHGKIGATYNIGGHNERQNLQVVQTICELLEELAPQKPAGIKRYADLVAFVQDRPGHDLRYAIDAGKIKRELGWSPKETFESGLRKTVMWYLANRDWTRRVQDGKYQRERLGLSV